MPHAPIRTQRFAPRARLTGPENFQRVLRRASARSSDACFIVLAVPNALDYARLGPAITKKRTPAAVARHRIKRIVRESFRVHQIELAGLDIVVMNQSATDKKTNAELHSSLSRHWKTISAQCKPSCC